MLNSPEAKGCFKLDNGQVRFTPKGQPDYRQRTLETWLQSTTDLLHDRHGVPLLVPEDEQGKITAKAKWWNDVPRCHPLLRTWADLEAAARLLHFLRHGAGPDFRPRFTLLPRVESDEPDLVQLQRLGLAKVLMPAPGFQMVHLRLCNLELGALAAVLQVFMAPDASSFASMFSEEVDPAVVVGARLAAIDLENPGNLKAAVPANDRHCLGIAKAALFAIPRGLGAGALREIARGDYRVDMTEPEAARVIKSMDTAFPDLAKYLRDDAESLLAENLGTKDRLIGEMLERSTGRKWNHATLRKTFRSFRKVHGSVDEGLWLALDRHNRNPVIGDYLKVKEVTPSLFRALFGSKATTLTGRARGQLVYTEARQAKYLDLADDAVKAVLYELAATGFVVVAVSNDEIMLASRSPINEPELLRIERLATVAVGQVLSDMPVRCICESIAAAPMASDA
jgi:hypothetical protein